MELMYLPITKGEVEILLRNKKRNAVIEFVQKAHNEYREYLGSVNHQNQAQVDYVNSMFPYKIKYINEKICNHCGCVLHVETAIELEDGSNFIFKSYDDVCK